MGEKGRKEWKREREREREIERERERERGWKGGKINVSKK